MTAKQEEVWALYAKGNTVSEIARTLGRGRSAVCTMIKTIQRNMKRTWERESAPCPYSDSCFSCPLKDCILDGCAAVRVNVLPGDGRW